MKSLPLSSCLSTITFAFPPSSLPLGFHDGRHSSLSSRILVSSTVPSASSAAAGEFELRSRREEGGGEGSEEKVERLEADLFHPSSFRLLLLLRRKTSLSELQCSQEDGRSQWGISRDKVTSEETRWEGRGREVN